jgi:hypothetical protein
MTKTEYRVALRTLGLSQVAAAKVLGVADRTSRSYALGERRVPEPVALALRLLIEKRQGVTSPSRKKIGRAKDSLPFGGTLTLRK